MGFGVRNFREFVVYHLIVLGLMMGGSYFVFDIEFIGAVFLGGLLATGNVWWYGRFLGRILNNTSESTAFGVVGKVVSKLMVLSGISALAVFWIHLDPVGFLLGFSVTFLSVVVLGCVLAVRDIGQLVS